MKATVMADRKAKLLLQRYLTKTQYQRFLDKQLIFVKGKSGSTYSFGIHPSIHVKDANRRWHRGCMSASPDGCMLSMVDYALLKLLLLRTNEQEFRRIAHLSQVG